MEIFYKYNFIYSVQLSDGAQLVKEEPYIGDIDFCCKKMGDAWDNCVFLKVYTENVRWGIPKQFHDYLCLIALNPSKHKNLDELSIFYCPFCGEKINSYLTGYIVTDYESRTIEVFGLDTDPSALPL